MKDIWSRISWPQATLLAVFVASVTCALIFTPEHTIDKVAALDWRAIASVAVGLTTALGAFFGGAVVRPREPGSPPSIPPLGKDGEP